MWWEEGQVRFKVVEDPKIFFNPKGRLARTLGVFSLRVITEILGEPLLVADAFTGVGVRALRYLREVDGVFKVISNDSAPRAVQLARENAEVLGLSEGIQFFNLEANRFFWHLNREETFPHFIDLDSFGSPSPYLDSSFFAVRVPGFLYITFTDTAPFCGVRSKASIRNYAAFGARTPFCHETGLRTALWSVVAAGGRHGFISPPLLSFFDGHSFRLLLKVERGKENFPSDKVGFVIFFPRSKEVQWVKGIKLPQCLGQEKPLFQGPLWTEDLQDKGFLNLLKKEIRKAELPGEKERLLNLLNTLEGEMGFPPYFFSIPRASRILDVSTPPRERVIQILIRSGWKASCTHFQGSAIKTDAPFLSFLSAVKEGARRSKTSGHPL